MTRSLPRFGGLLALFALAGCYPGLWMTRPAPVYVPPPRAAVVAPGPTVDMSGAFAPMMSQMYTQLLFAFAFGSGGYAVAARDYKPGEWTRWVVPREGRPETEWAVVERAYLFDDTAGNVWWKVKYVDPKHNHTVIEEALFDKAQQKLLRLRAQFPNEAPKEIPVEEGTTYHPPRKLTKESLAGAIKGTGPVVVPAGSFTARRAVFGDPGSGTSEWFLVDTVPGGCVKVMHTAAGAAQRSEPDAHHYTIELKAYGTGAVSELGITRDVPKS